MVSSSPCRLKGVKVTLGYGSPIREIQVGFGKDKTVWQRALKKCGNIHPNRECQKSYYKMIVKKVFELSLRNKYDAAFIFDRLASPLQISPLVC